MRATRWLLGLGTSFSVLGAFAAGCGSSTTGSSPAQDSGTGMDVTMEAAMEAATEAAVDTGSGMDAKAEAACVPEGGIGALTVPDAALNDSGATAAGCVTCFTTMSACAMIITDCNASCTCVADFLLFEACIATPSMSLQTCAVAHLANALPASDLTALLGCGTACAIQCGYTFPTDSGMAGDTGTTDSATGG